MQPAAPQGRGTERGRHVKINIPRGRPRDHMALTHAMWKYTKRRMQGCPVGAAVQLVSSETGVSRRQVERLADIWERAALRRSFRQK